MVKADHFQAFDHPVVIGTRIAVDVDFSVRERFVVSVCGAKRSFPRIAWAWIQADQAEGSSQPNDAVFGFEDALKDTVESVVLDGVGGKGEVSHGWSLVQAWNKGRFLVEFGEAKRTAPPWNGALFP